MIFFLPLDDSNECNDNDGIATIAGGGGETAPAAYPMLPSYAVGHLVLDVLGCVLKVGCVDVLVFSDFVVGRLTGRHHHFLWWWRWRGGKGVGGIGGDEEFMGVCCCVFCRLEMQKDKALTPYVHSWY